jgi:hypothetical protein
MVGTPLKTLFFSRNLQQQLLGITLFCDIVFLLAKRMFGKIYGERSALLQRTTSF